MKRPQWKRQVQEQGESENMQKKERKERWKNKDTKLGDTRQWSSLFRPALLQLHKYHLVFSNNRLCQWFFSDSESALSCLQGQSGTKCPNSTPKIWPRFSRHLTIYKGAHLDVQTLPLTSREADACMECWLGSAASQMCATAYQGF